MFIQTNILLVKKNTMLAAHSQFLVNEGFRASTAYMHLRYACFSYDNLALRNDFDKLATLEYYYCHFLAC